MRTKLIAVIAGTTALFAFAWAHKQAVNDGIDMFEHAAYLHWQGQCKQDDTLCTHNSQGGYIEACGEEPGLLGDDC